MFANLSWDISIVGDYWGYSSGAMACCQPNETFLMTALPTECVVIDLIDRTPGR